VRLRRRVGLQIKFILIILALLGATFAVFTYIVIRLNTQTLRDRQKSEATAFASLATTPIGNTFLLYQDSGKVLIAQQVDKLSGLSTVVDNVAVVDITGRVQFSQHEPPPKVSAAVASAFEPTTVNSQTGEISQIVYPFQEDFGAHRYSIVYNFSYHDIQVAAQRSLLATLLLGLLGLMVAAYAMYILIDWLFLRPLQTVRDLALVISQGKFDQQIVIDRRDEISDLGKAVNEMARVLTADIIKLRELDELKTEFMMIASHNLRTPLVVINGYLDLLKNLDLDKETHDMVTAIADGGERLNRLSEDILTVASIEAGEELVKLQPASLTTILEKLASDSKLLADKQQVSFVSQLNLGDTQVAYDSTYLREALMHILDNALKFSKTGGTVTLAARHDQTQAIITISDTGIGIEAKELERLFTKFHRGTSTLNYDYEGVGLGLYVAKLVIDRHHGSIDITSQPQKGTVVTVKLPLVKATQAA